MFKRLAIVLASILASPAMAGEVARVETEFARAAFVVEHDMLAPGETTRIALDMTLEPGWHTYWKNAGDSGEAVSIDWTLPDGVTAGDIVWPAPHRQPYDPLMNYGYSDAAVFTLPLFLPAAWPAGQPVPVSAEVYWLVCAEVCIPEQGTIAFELPTGPASALDPAAKDIFARANAMQPQPNPYAARYQFDETHLRLRFEGDGFDAASLKDAYFFPAKWGVIDHAAPQVITTDATGLTLVVPHSPEMKPDVSAPLSGVLELIAETAAGENRMALTVSASEGLVTTGAAGFSGMAGGATLPVALVFAFIGGVILNLMPCVFPVLALKAIGFAKSAHDVRGERLTHGLAYTAGVVVLFLALAVGMLLLKAAGAEVGWGFQLQNPWVVAGLAYLLFVVGLNLSGVFEVNVAVPDVGEAQASRGGASGAFFTGALAAIVATPCTAPFMATAIGATLTMGSAQTLGVFAALGLGLAAPFLLLSLSPAIARMIPKPGVWMVRLKELLAFPMYATAVWLIWVLGSLSGRNAMALAALGCVLLGLAAWAYGVAQSSGRRGQAWGFATAIAAVAGVLFLSSGFGSRPIGEASAMSAQMSGPAQPFSARRLADLRAEGRPVFVNMTADWCITCKVNERVALGESFEKLLKDREVVYLKGDWTARDPEITALLQKFGRAGVPLYAVFPRQGEPVLLPQILTRESVENALNSV